MTVGAIGCGDDEFGQPMGAAGTGTAGAGQLMPAGDQTDVAASVARRQNDTDGEDDDKPLKRETVKVEPYRGPPIFLDEPPPPPAATVVERQRTITQNFEDGGVHIERQVTKYSDDRYVNDGTYKEYYPSGKPFVEGQYDDGQQVGEWTYWHEDGQKNRTDVYKDGELHGSWEVFRADGTLEARREFNEGQRHGEWIVYDDTGKIPLQERHFQDGKPHGTWKEWYASGSPKAEYHFENGLRNGEAIEWYEDGDKRAHAHYRDDKLHGEVTKWDMDGKKIVQYFDDGSLLRDVNE